MIPNPNQPEKNEPVQQTTRETPRETAKAPVPTEAKALGTGGNTATETPKPAPRLDMLQQTELLKRLADPNLDPNTRKGLIAMLNGH